MTAQENLNTLWDANVDGMFKPDPRCDMSDMPMKSFRGASSGTEQMRQPPPDFNDKQKSMWEMLTRAASTSPNFVDSATEVLARNPELCKDFIESHRRYTVEKIGGDFITDLSGIKPEMLHQMLELPPDVLGNIAQASSTLKGMGMSLSLEEVREVINISVANSVMEEGSMQESESGYGVTMKSPSPKVRAHKSWPGPRKY